MSRATRFRVMITVVGAAMLASSPASAHGIGGRSDLPVPVSYFVAGAGLVLALSFVALAVLWPEPRLQEWSEGKVIARWGRWPLTMLAAIGLLGLALVVMAGIVGEDRRTNAAPVLLWVYFWLVVPFLGAIVGDLWRHMNPWRTLAGDRQRLGYPHVTTAGVWPATVVLLAFIWLELVYVDSASPIVVGTAALLYSLYVGAAVAIVGRERAFGSFEAFTAYNSLIGSVGPLELDADGAWRWHGWLRRLPTFPTPRGLTFFIVAMIGTVTYDGMSAAEWWEDLWGSVVRNSLFGTVALVGTVAAIGGAYWLASWAASRIGGGLTASEVAVSFAHTLVPIALAYAVAHYFTLVLFEGQLLGAVASDPLGLGADAFNTATNRINFWLSPTAVWYVQVAAIVLGHLAAIALAHDRALAVFSRERAVRSQYAMLVLMVALTGLGLILLAAG